VFAVMGASTQALVLESLVGSVFLRCSIGFQVIAVGCGGSVGSRMRT
jgi:hypothetical protein